MQAIWKGAISFGLISIPVRLYGATEEKSLRFHLLHASCGGRIRYNRTCLNCGQDNLTPEDLVRGYEYEKGQYVTFTEDELSAVPLETVHSIEVVQFVPAEQIDPLFYQRAYYLAPEELGIKAYALLRRALVETGRVAVAKVALRDRERLACLRARGDVLVLETMYWPDEVREPAFPALGHEVSLRDQELQMARALVENLTEDFDPQAFEDRYRKALLELVEAKVAGREIVRPPAAAEVPASADLMEALKASLEAVKERRAARRAAG